MSISSQNIKNSFSGDSGCSSLNISRDISFFMGEQHRDFKDPTYAPSSRHFMETSSRNTPSLVSRPSTAYADLLLEVLQAVWMKDLLVRGLSSCFTMGPPFRWAPRQPGCGASPGWSYSAGDDARGLQGPELWTDFWWIRPRPSVSPRVFTPDYLRFSLSINRWLQLATLGALALVWARDPVMYMQICYERCYKQSGCKTFLSEVSLLLLHNRSSFLMSSKTTRPWSWP